MNAIKPVFSLYKTIVLGKYPKNLSEFKKDAERKKLDYYIGIERMMLDPIFSISQEVVEVDLVLVSGNDLLCVGNWVEFKDVISQAQECGLELCPAEVGPALFLQDISRAWRTIVMEPINGEVFEMTYRQEDLNPSTDGWSRDEKPLFEEERLGPKIPLLSVTRLTGGTTGYDKHLVFLKPRKSGQLFRS